MKPSLTSIISVVFLVLVLHSIWNLVVLFRTPTCERHENCYHSYLNSRPPLDLIIFVSETAKRGGSFVVLKLENFNYESTFERDISFTLPKSVHKNGTLSIHTFVLPSRTYKPNLSLNEVRKIQEATHIQGSLTQYEVPKNNTFNLLNSNAKTRDMKPIPHLRKTYSILMCTDVLSIPDYGIPMEIIRLFRVNHKREFLPIIVEDVLHSKQNDLEEIANEGTEGSFTFVYKPVSIGKLKFLVQMEMTFKQLLLLGFSEKDIDEVKGVFADTNLYLLCATLFIGSIHLLLDFLSFKNDVSFWKSHRSIAGLSTRTVLWRAFSQTIIFLYLMDSGTSLLVLIPSGIGVLIEVWKVKKVLNATIIWHRGLTIRFNKNENESNTEVKTREYDEESMRYLSYVLYPLCLCGAIYSLIYQPHKSWYSWTINSLANGVYVFGFLFMLPQLFINYKLKSVAALPWRAFTYKAFNTFIDDIFAFIITMPTAHRLACFRDDIVFIIYLYQRWLYPVDKRRQDDIGSELLDPHIETVDNKEDEIDRKKKD